MERVGTILNISLQLVANLAIAFGPVPAVQLGKTPQNAEHGYFRMV